MLTVVRHMHKMEFPLGLGATAPQRVSSDQDVAAIPFDASVCVYFAGLYLKPGWEP